jgi:hypothetical protein
VTDPLFLLVSALAATLGVVVGINNGKAMLEAERLGPDSSSD